MSVYNQTKAAQKAYEKAHYGNTNRVMTFNEWLHEQLCHMQKEKADVKTCTYDGVFYAQIQWPGQATPKIFTENEFYEEFQKSYLAPKGLYCSIPFEENVGVF